MRIRGIVTKAIILTILMTLMSTSPFVIQMLKESKVDMSTSIGNMPKNIDETDNVGKFSSLALDSENNPHIAYYDETNGDLLYTKYNGWEWNTTIVDSDDDVGSYTSLVLDKINNPHISYYNATSSSLKYAYFDGLNWTNTTIDQDGDVGTYSSIDVSSNMNPHISYRDETNTDLKYAYFNGTSWINMTLDGTLGSHNVGTFTSIALDSGNMPHIAYYDYTGGDLEYMYNDGNTWVKITAYDTQSVGQHASIVLDSQDNPHFSFYNQNFQDLMYTHFNGTDWILETVDSAGKVGEFSSIALDVDDNPRIVYKERTDNNNGHVKHAWKWNDTWNSHEIDEEGEYGSIVVDSNNRSHFSYYDLSDEDLRYLSHSGAHVDVIDDRGMRNDFGGLHLKLDSQGIPHIVYQSTDDGFSVNYAKLNVSASTPWQNVWDLQEIETGISYFGSWISLDLDSQDNPHISYYGGDGSNGLHYATYNGTDWNIEEVGTWTHNRIGWYSSIKIDSIDNPHIVFSSYDTAILKYTTIDSNGDWVIETIDSSNNKKRWISLTLSSSDVPHMCYYNEQINRLSYTYYSGSEWIIDHNVQSPNITISGNTGQFCDIEMDQYNDPHISFDYDGATGLGYIKRNSSTGVWEGQSIVDSLNGISFTSLELDSKEQPHIIYHSTTGTDNLYYTWFDEELGEWRGRDSGLDHTNHYYDSTNWGRFGVLDLDGNDSAHIGFYDPIKTEVLYYTDNYYPTRDTDGDGIPDSEDNFPSNPSETTDYDGDGIGDNADNDDDDDGVIDLEDSCQFGIIGAGPDFDGDGCKDSEDEDDDNDGFDDDSDACSNGMTGIGSDLDNDGCQDAEDLDIDGDGVLNENDAFPEDPTESVDSDGDGVGDNSDAFPNDVNETDDSDGDGVGDNSDAFPNDPDKSVIEEDDSTTNDTANETVNNTTNDTANDTVNDTVNDTSNETISNQEDNVDDDSNTEQDDMNENNGDVGESNSEEVTIYGLKPEMLAFITGILMTLVIISLIFMQLKVRSLNQQLKESKEISERWLSLDYDGDGEISDKEFEAYKLIHGSEHTEESDEDETSSDEDETSSDEELTSDD